MSYNFEDIRNYDENHQGEIESIVGKVFLIGYKAGEEGIYNVAFNRGYRHCLADYDLSEIDTDLLEDYSEADDEE